MEIDCRMLARARLDRMVSDGPFSSHILPGTRQDILLELEHILQF